MARAYKCDRCGELVEKTALLWTYTMAVEKWTFEWRLFEKEIDTKNPDWRPMERAPDLCRPCAEAILQDVAGRLKGSLE